MTAVASTLEVSRSRQYERRKNGEGSRKRHYRKADDEGYLFLIRRITNDRLTYGYRRVTALLNRQLVRENRPRVNAKRVYRLMKMNGLLLQRYTGRPARLHEGGNPDEPEQPPLVFGCLRDRLLERRTGPGGLQPGLL